MAANNKIPGSFRDPSGFLFLQDGVLYRQINLTFQEDYDHLMSSGLYQSLVDDGLLIPHEEAASLQPAPASDAYKIIKPELIRFISYPYEWCFSQLKDAALVTLEIQQKALEFGMALKDASAYNIQFINGKPQLIDTLSFHRYAAGDSWQAYRQFCQHFFAPLALMSYTDVRLNQLSRIFLDGIPLDLTSRLLPWRTRFKFGIYSHIHLHAKSSKYHTEKPTNEPPEKKKMKFSKFAMRGLLDNLTAAIKKLRWRPEGTEWSEYYEITNYSSLSMEHKKELVAEFLNDIETDILWDLGANTGLFSEIASEKGFSVIACDIDPAAVEKNYQRCIEQKKTKILPLILDLTNPSPAIGWQNRERTSFLKRETASTVMALALIHHLAIGNNLPLSKTAEFFSDICQTLIIEFVPKTDSQVQRLFSTRDDIFPEYTQAAFESEYGKHFTIEKTRKIRDSERTLYRMRKS